MTTSTHLETLRTDLREVPRDRDRVLNAILRLDNWVENNGYAGWDPYDIKGERFYVRLLRAKKSLVIKAARRLAADLTENFPVAARRLFDVKPQINAKAMALFALSYLRLYKITEQERFLLKHDYCLEWMLSNNHCSDKSLLGWGYPFDWQSQILIPRNTPLCVPTVLAGHALLDRVEHLGDNTGQEPLIRIKNFLLDGLNRTYFPDNDSLCFSYSPIDDFQVVNANLYTASFLTRYGVVFDDEVTLETARKARRFSIAQLDRSGSWPYWASTNRVSMPRHVDNYHTGIILQWLRVIEKYDSRSDDIRKPLAMGSEYYFSNLFTPDGIPRFSDRQLFPVDIHGAAQALVTFNHLYDLVDPGLVKAVFDFTLTNMHDPDRGYFYYRLLSPSKVIKIPYVRWSQAWMLYALTNLLEYMGRMP